MCLKIVKLFIDTSDSTDLILWSDKNKEKTICDEIVFLSLV